MKRERFVEKVQAAFQSNDQIAELIVTADGACFAAGDEGEHNAYNHAKDLDRNNVGVLKISRSQFFNKKGDPNKPADCPGIEIGSTKSASPSDDAVDTDDKDPVSTAASALKIQIENIGKASEKQCAFILKGEKNEQIIAACKERIAELHARKDEKLIKQFSKEKDLKELKKALGDGHRPDVMGTIEARIVQLEPDPPADSPKESK